MKDTIARRARGFRSWLLRETKSEIRCFQELEWLTRRFALPLPATNVSVQPLTLAWIVNDIRLNDRRCIVELGSGCSTQMIAQALKACFPDAAERPRFISVEENAAWIDIVRRHLTADGSADAVEFVHAPRPELAAGRRGWYAEAPIRNALGQDRVDCLLVDAPYAYGRANAGARYPALDFFFDRMAERYALFIDDAQRPAERKLLRDWAARAGLRATTMSAYLGVITKGQHYVAKPQ